MPPSPELSIVLPCYNEAAILPAFIARVADCAGETGLGFEILAVDDGSSDGTAEVLDELAGTIPELRVLHFSRNFGHMAALTAGLDHAEASGAVISMDSDGQHPPELIPELLRRWQAGADIVQTIRKETGDAGLKKRLTSSMFYFLLNKLGDTHVIPGAADFRLMSRDAVDALKRLPEKARFIRGLVSWIGFRVEYVEFDAPARLAGTTKYSFIKMLRFALDGITSFSTVLLRMAMVAGVFVLAGCLLYGLLIVYLYLFHGGQLVSGWSSLMLALLIMGGFNLVALGIVGEYIGRIYAEVKNRPVYLLRKNR